MKSILLYIYEVYITLFEHIKYVMRLLYNTGKICNIVVVSVTFCIAAEKNRYQIANTHDCFMKFSDIMPDMCPYKMNTQKITFWTL